MPLDYIYVKIALVCYVIVCPFVLLTFVLGHFLRSRSAKFDNPKYWARPWILTSVICSDLILFCVSFGEHSCLSVKFSLASTVSYKTSTALLGFHVFISIYNPYILSGKKQLAIWSVLIFMSWLTGLAFAFVAAKQYNIMPNSFGHFQPHEMTTSAFTETEITSGYDKFDQTTSILDTLNIDFDTNIFRPDPVTVLNDTYMDFEEIAADVNYRQEHCVVVSNFESLISIVPLLFLLCAALILAAIPRRLLRMITKCFKNCHSPLSPSQKHVSKWIKQQRISSLLFIELLSIYTALHFSCGADFQEYCSYLYKYVDFVYPTVFALSCFMLKDVRNMLLKVYFAGCRRCTRDPDVDITSEQALDTSQL